MKTFAPILAIAALVSLAACTGSPATSPSPTPTPSASPSAAAHNSLAAEGEACEHLKGGPAVAVTTTAEATGAPEVKADHKRYDLTFVAGAGGNRGTVRFNSAEAVEWSFFMNKDIPVVVRDAAGVSLPILERSTSSTLCGEIKAQNVFLLGVGPYTVEFGPTTETTVGLIVEETHPEGH